MIVNTASLKNILETISKHTDVVTFVIMRDGVAFCVRGIAGTSMVRGVAKPEFFVEYGYDSEDSMEISVSVDKFQDVLRGLKTDVELIYDDAHKSIEMKSGRVTKSFSVLGDDDYTVPKPNISCPIKFTLSQADVKEIVDAINSVKGKDMGSSTMLTASAEGVRFKVDSKTMCEWFAPGKDVALEGMGESEYTTDLLLDILAAGKFGNTIQIFFGDDFPIMSVVMDGESVEDSTMIIQQMLAPRLRE